MTCQCCTPTVEEERDSHPEPRPDETAQGTGRCGPACRCGGDSDAAADHAPPSVMDRPSLASTSRPTKPRV